MNEEHKNFMAGLTINFLLAFMLEIFLLIFIYHTELVLKGIVIFIIGCAIIKAIPAFYEFCVETGEIFRRED